MAVQVHLPEDRQHCVSPPEARVKSVNIFSHMKLYRRILRGSSLQVLMTLSCFPAALENAHNALDCCTE